MSASSEAGPLFRTLEGHFAVSSFDPDTGDGFHEDSRRAYDLEARGSTGRLGYGLKYFSVGSEFERLKTDRKKRTRDPKKDREGTEAWLQSSFGRVGLKSFATRYHDNLEQDPNRARFTEQKAGATITYTISSWPYLGYSATYARGIRTSSDEPGERASYRGSMETAASGLDYSGEKWSASVSAEYSKSGDFSGPVEIATYYVGGSFYPFGSLSLTPSLTWMQEEYPELDVSTLTRSADLTLGYTPPNSSLKFTAFGGYSASENRDWGFDNRYFYGYAGVDWPTRGIAPGGNMSFLLGYDRYVDELYPGSNTQDMSVWLKFRVPLDLKASGGARKMEKLDFLSAGYGEEERWLNR
jgi:hypothetical protein